MDKRVVEEYINFLKSLDNIEKYGMILTHTGIVRKFSKREKNKKVKALFVDYKKKDLEDLKEKLNELFPNLKIHIKIFKGERKIKEPIMFVAIASPFRKEALKALEFTIEELKNKILTEKEIF